MRNLLSLFAAAIALNAAPPVLTTMEPWSAQRGKAVTVVLSGNNLPEGAKVFSSLPGTFTPLSLPPEDAGKRVSYLIELKADAAAGLYPLRLETASGLSNILLFTVGAFPEIREDEKAEAKNDSIETAQAVNSTPIVVNGTLRPADRDTYKIYAKGGERRVIEVEARRLGSAVDPAIRILDATGKLLARVEDTPGLGVDCRVDFTFPREGNYYVEVRDARFSDQIANFYRLKMGSYAFAENIFPLGWRQGEPVDIELSGGNLASAVKVKTGDGWVRTPGPEGSLPLPIVRGDLPETMEPAATGPHQLALNTVMNGRIAKPGDRDNYRVAVKPEGNYVIELQARGLGTSRLDGVITIYDKAGKKLDSAGDQPPKQSVFATIAASDVASDPYIPFQVPKGTSEITVAVEDVAGGGGPGYGYRLTVREQPPDFLLTLATPYVNIPSTGAAIITIGIERRGFGGAIDLSVANLPDDLEVTGGHVPAELVMPDNRGLSRRGVLTIAAKPGAKPRAFNLEVIGQAKMPDGSNIRRKASGPGMITAIRGTLGFVDPNRRNQNKPFVASWLGLDLPAHIGYEPSGWLEVQAPKKVRIIQGMKHEFPWSFASKNPGMRPPMNVITDTPGGIDLRITDREGGKNPGKGNITMNTTIGTPVGTFDVIFAARAGAAMDPASEILYAPAIIVEVIQGFEVSEPKQNAPLTKGGKVVLAGKVRREPEFTMPVTITPDVLPLGVSCPPVDVPSGQSDFGVTCEAGADAAAGEYKILLNPSSILPEGEKGKVPYKIAPVEAALSIAK